MRISLLLQREPFGQILEKTLSRFWHATYDQAFEVTWCPHRSNPSARHQPFDQSWLCNIYLNAIFSQNAEPTIFDPIRREFARSVVRWRRPLQQAYVALATSRHGAPWLAQAALGVTPAVPEVTGKLIVAGNHKLRILDHRAGVAYGILKHGFSSNFMQRELSARQQAAQLSLPVPKLEAIAADRSWFCEHYLSGTPINRLTASAARRKATQSAVNALACLLTHSQQEEALDDYSACLYSRIQYLVENNQVLKKSHKHTIRTAVNTLMEHIGTRQATVGGCITTALTHGDFQPANILVNQDGSWLIDWEYAARRQIGYDALVFGLHSRFPRGLATRLQVFVTQGPEGNTEMSQLFWPGISWQAAAHRQLSSLLFLLEELVLHLEENDNPVFLRPGLGLLALITELGAYKSMLT